MIHHLELVIAVCSKKTDGTMQFSVVFIWVRVLIRPYIIFLSITILIWIQLRVFTRQKVLELGFYDTSLQQDETSKRPSLVLEPSARGACGRRRPWIESIIILIVKRLYNILLVIWTRRASTMSNASGPKAGGGKKSEYQDKDKPTQIRFSNITAAKG